MIISKINLNGPNHNEITLSSTSLYIQGPAGTTDTITVTQLGNGEISAQSSNTNICTVSVSDNTIVVTSVGEGSTTITISTAATISYEAASTTCTITTKFISNILSENTLEVIQQVAQAHEGSLYWNVGDRTEIIPVSAFGYAGSTNNMCAFIIGFDHNSSIEGTGITFQMGMTSSGSRIAFVDNSYGFSTTAESTYNYFRMSSISYTYGGWSSCNMRKNVIPAFASAMPVSWKNIIRSDVTKYTNNRGYYSSNYSSYITATTESFFLLAVYEVFGTTTSINTYESTKQQQYTYYANGNSKIMYKSSATTTACSWWLRSPRRSTTSAYCRSHFNCVTSAGAQGVGYAHYCYGFAPAFIVG